MNPHWRIALRPGIRLYFGSGDADLVLLHPWGATRVRTLPPAVETGFRTLESAGSFGVAEDDLPERVARVLRDNFAFACSLISATDTGPAVEIEPITGSASWPVVAGNPIARLSRFTAIRAENGKLLMESPLATHRAIVRDGELLSALTALTGAARCATLPSGPALAALASCGLIATADDDGGFTEDASLWSFHDLQSWWRSRPGLHDYPVGASSDRVMHRSGSRPDGFRPGEAITLPPVDLTRLRSADVTLTEAIEQRRSTREFGRPITAGELGELLYRAVGARDRGRAYPAAGGIDELTVYLAVGRCTGLPSGVYRYLPAEHALAPKEDRFDPAVLLAAAKGVAGAPHRPDVLVVLTSRTSELAGKYQGLGYSLTLRNTGVVYQNLYLVAAAMGLAACALGFGDNALIQRALSLRFPEEIPVGEFMLGTRQEMQTD